MRLSVEEAACQILESVKQRLPQVSVDYETFGGTHYFYIDQAGARLRVRFPEEALQRKEKAQLQPVIREVVEHVISASRRAPLRQFSSVLMLSFAESNAVAVRHMAAEPTLPIGRR